ncbi:MAG: ATP-binding cassette domain-containing protein [Dehalococcoidia bacterium]|nr:ATP-binding cassette domain-containing protein [Dehalococcoidia bacterium]
MADSRHHAAVAAPAATHVVVKDVAKGYPGVRALAPIAFSVQPGERLALAGPSGSGKTTLLYLLAGLLQPDAGQLCIDGRDLAEMRPGRELARLVGMVHQQYDLVSSLPVLHNVLAGRLGQWSLAGSALSLIWPRERHLAEEALARLGIADKASQRTSRLSGGEQQRVAIARLMLQSPRIILADEPVSSLDPALAEEMMRLLVDLVEGSGKTLIASLHSPYLIKKYCTRVIGLRQGEMQFDLPAADLTEAVLDRLYDLDRRRPENGAIRQE